jgi:hypothetical protein
MRFRYMDERQGFWTHVITKDNCVEFRPTSAYARGRLVALVFASGIVYSLAEPLVQSVKLLGWGLITLVAVSLIKMVWSSWRSPARIVVLESDENRMARGRHVLARDIVEIIVRENVGREVGDGMLAQMYLILKSEDIALLVHQRGLSQYRRVKETATELAHRWQVPLVDDLTEVAIHQGLLVDLLHWFIRR